jgi:hypothetical protein
MTGSPPAPPIPAVGSLADRAPTIGSSDTGPTPLALGPQAEPDLIDTQILLEVLDSAVRGIFSVALTLSAARNLTEGPATVRLDQALDEIDDLVRQLRHTALNAHLPPRVPGQGASHPPAAHPQSRPPISSTSR